MHPEPGKAERPGISSPLEPPAQPLQLDNAHGGSPTDVTHADTLTGSRCIVAFDPHGLEIRFGSAAPATVSIRHPGRSAAASLSTLGLVRNVDADDTAATLRCFVFHDLPCAVLEWSPHDPVGNATVRLDLTARIGAGPAALRTDDGTVSLDAPGRTLRIITHDDVRLDVRADNDAVRITAVRHAAAGPMRIAIAVALMEGDDIEAAIDAARNADARIRARRATLRRRQREALRLRSSDPNADAALASAVSRLDACPQPDPADPAARGQLALAALASGEHHLARSLAHAARADSGTGPAADAAGLLGRLVWTWAGDRSMLPPRLHDAEPADLAGAAPTEADAAARIVARNPVHPESVTDPILGLVFDVLGAAPDAVRGRLRLRPVLPAAWSFMEVAGLRMADARIRLRIERIGRGLHIRIEQTEGAVPIRAILEPVVRARALLGATIDGQPASLVPRPLGDRIVVPVQLALDHERHLILDLA